MKCSVTYFLIVVFVLVLTIPDLYARPHRQKRVSDQRLAELETLLALAKMRGKLITVPIGFGRIDPAKIGKRRRRSDKMSDNDLETLSSILDEDENDSKSNSSENSPQYENLLRQYLLAWARDQNSIE